MALANPLPISVFADLFRVEDITLVQAFQQQRSAQGGGNTGYADRAPSMWTARIKTTPLDNAEAEGVMALINSRGGGLKEVLLYNYRLPYPVNDPDGALLAVGSSMAASLLLDFTNDSAFAVEASTQQTIRTLTDRLHISMAGFPPGFILKRGTYFGIQFDQSRYYLGQVVETKTASSQGAISSTEIWPPLPALVSVGAVLNFAKPPAKFQIVPGSAMPSRYDVMNSTIEFSAEQTYSR